MSITKYVKISDVAPILADSLLMFMNTLGDDVSVASKFAPLDSLPYLRWMCIEVIDNIRGEFDIDKANRWIGCVQWTLVIKGYSSLEQERRRLKDALGLDDHDRIVKFMY